jgi:hypothetical protein
MRVTKALTTSLTTVAVIGVLAISSSTLAREKGRGHTGAPVVYVFTQGLYYDSIVLTDLPAKGSFQQLFTDQGPSGLETEFGPGDIGYLGGRWWVDGNDNGVMDVDPDEPGYEMGDAFFLCPLLGPGRDEI